MKTWKLLLLALVPGLWGWLCNRLVAMLYTDGHYILLILVYYLLQAPAAIVFCLWLGRRCGRSERRYPACLLLAQWPSLVSFALYVWQFWFVSDEARNSLLALLGQAPSIPLTHIATCLVLPFSGDFWLQADSTAVAALSLLMLAALFSLGFLWGRRSRPSAA